MTQEQASFLIDYLELMEAKTTHQRNMRELSEEYNISEAELDGACRALSAIAGRDYSLL